MLFVFDILITLYIQTEKATLSLNQAAQPLVFGCDCPKSV